MTNLSSRTYDEKRDFIRMKVDTEVILTVSDENRSVKGYCRDLSGTGMLIEVDEAITEGLKCKTTLPSNNEAFPSLDATVQVLRCTKVDDDKYHLGMEILDIEN